MAPAVVIVTGALMGCCLSGLCLPETLSVEELDLFNFDEFEYLLPIEELAREGVRSAMIRRQNDGRFRLHMSILVRARDEGVEGCVDEDPSQCFVEVALPDRLLTESEKERMAELFGRVRIETVIDPVCLSSVLSMFRWDGREFHYPIAACGCEPITRMQYDQAEDIVAFLEDLRVASAG